MTADATEPTANSQRSSMAPRVPALGILRLHQWIKNAVIFAPIILGGRASDMNAWRAALIGFVAFGLVASGTYIINDICDRDHDRLHPTKRYRPIASGALSMTAAILLSAVCIVAGLAAGYGLEPPAFALMLLYIAMTLAYSLWLKTMPLLDVVVIAGLFTLRLAFGTALGGVHWSPWLFVLSMSAFLSLALAKRFAELMTSTKQGQIAAGRGYTSADIPFIRSLGISSATAGVLIMVIYMIEEAFPRGVYTHPQALWAVPIILLLFFSRIWLTAERGELIGDPVTFALRDKACNLFAFALLAVFLIALA